MNYIPDSMIPADRKDLCSGTLSKKPAFGRTRGLEEQPMKSDRSLVSKLTFAFASKNSLDSTETLLNHMGEDTSDVSFLEEEEFDLRTAIGQPNAGEPATRRKQAKFWRKKTQLHLAQYGTKSRKLAISFMNLGLAEFERGNADAAVNALATSASIFQNLATDTRLGYAMSLHFISLAGLACGKISIAKDAIEECYKIRLVELGPLHIDTIDSYCQIGYIYIYTRQFTLAMSMLSEGFKVMRAVFDDSNEKIVDIATEIGTLCVQLGEKPRAQWYFNFALRSCHSLHLWQKAASLEEQLYKYGLSETRVDL
jgi:tetratricopeptide (TPR) repeat protein